MTSTAPRGDSENEPPAKPKSELLRRVASALVLGIVALAAVLLSPWTFLALVIIASGLLLWEWGSATRGNGFDGTALLQTVCVVAIAVFVAVHKYQLGALILAACAGAIFFVSQDKKAGGVAVAGLLYVACPAVALVWLRSDPEFGLAAILFLLAVAWTTDTASYIGGRCLGGPKFLPSISPKKTWSGYVVGTLAPILVGLGFALYLGDTSLWILAVIAVAIAVACQIGDLLESAIKRRLGIKDMSQLIPGHGGLFDRIDSLLLAAIVAALIAMRNLEAPGAGLLIW